MVKLDVTGPVTVEVSPVDLRFYAYESGGGSSPDERPWKWWAMVRLKFTIGELTTTKTVRQSYAWYKSGWPRWERPSEAEITVGRQTVLDNLRDRVARHGFDPPEFVIKEWVDPQSRDLSIALNRSFLPTTWQRLTKW